MAGSKLQLWFAFPDELTDERSFARSLSILSEDERARQQRFRFEASRREYLAAHTLVRTALSHSEPVPPDAWRFRMNGYGKPFVEQASDLSFNLSRRPGLVACLVARGLEVGVDLEAEARSREILEMASRVFSAKEQAELNQLDAERRLGRALSLWTLKESYCKARGMGLSLPLQKFSFLGSSPLPMRLEVDSTIGGDGDRWKFCSLDHAGHRIALMAERSPESYLELWTMHPDPARSSQLCRPQPEWFPRESA